MVLRRMMLFFSDSFLLTLFGVCITIILMAHQRMNSVEES